MNSSSQPLLIETPETTKYETLTREQLIAELQFSHMAQKYLLGKLEDEYRKKGYPEQEKIAIKDQSVVLKHKFFAGATERRPHPGRERKTPLSLKEKKVLLPSQRYPQLDIIETEIELENAPSCKLCSSVMEKMNATENAEFLSMLQKIYHIVRQKRAKYRCSNCHGDIHTAPLPPRLIPGGSFSDDIAIDVAVSKYADHLPIERYVVAAQRWGLTGLSPQTLIDQTHALADHLESVYEAIRKEMEQSPVLHADETPWKLLEGDETPNWQMWGFFNEKGSYYSAHNTRAGEIAGEFLKTCKAEYLVSYAFSGYGKCLKGTTKKNVYCNAHARRKWIEAELNYPDATKVIEWYGQNYEIEREIKEKPPDEKRQARQSQSKPIYDEIQKYLFEMQCLPQSWLGKARDYMLKYWEELTRFLEDGCIPIDNNLAERGLRGVVLGRKNYYGNHSKRRARTTSILYSIIESCKLNNVEPYRYLKDTVKAIHFDQEWSTPFTFSKYENPN